MNVRNHPLTLALRDHRPLMVSAVGSALVTFVALGGLVLDGRTLTGAPVWLKSFKFGVSIAIYTATLAWMIYYVQRGRRWARRLGTVIAVGIGGELILITGQVVRGHTSHFNYQTPLDGAIYTTMAVMIVVVWLANLAIGVQLAFQRIADRALASGIRLGVVVGLVGMAVAFFMTTGALGVIEPSGNGIVGAHSVGGPDGGPGLPVTGWSTVAGDLRVPHFLGIHALQALPLLALLLGPRTGGYARLRDERTRVRLVRVAGAAYLGVVVLTTWQAIRGQSLVHPDATTLLAAGALFGATAVAVALVLLTARPEAVVAPPGPGAEAGLPLVRG